jgi:transcriptional regulator with PAS, ATPase and Fis domain
MLAHWARRAAPLLMDLLKTAYLADQKTQPNTDATAFELVARPAADSSAAQEQLAPTLKELEREHLERVLAQTRTLDEAAQKLGIAVSTLWRKRKRYNLK